METPNNHNKENHEKVLMKGNEAIAEAAIRAGCRHFFGYPITPQTELAAYMAKKLPKIEGAVFLQAESEIAAINMVIGGAAAGARVMTSSSSPGISLKSEGLSYLAGCDLPAVIVNVQRGGPGLGGIQPSQADYFQATRGGGHGDFHILCLAPGSVQEMFALTGKAFDLADRYRMTVMLLCDGILGQMMEPVALDSVAATVVEKPWCVGATSCRPNQTKLVSDDRGRQNAAPTTRNVVNSLYLQPEELERTNFERYERYADIAANETLHATYEMDDAEIVVVAYGATARVSQNAVAAARKEGIKAGLFRPITLWPFPSKALADIADKTNAFVCVEMSMGQMIEDVKLSIDCKKPVSLCNRTGGMVPQPEDILQAIKKAGGVL